MFFIFSPSVRSPTTMLSYQTSLKVEKFLSGRWNKNSFKGFRWRRYSLKETTGQFGLGFSYIKPPSKPSSSSRRLFCKFIRCFAQVHCSVLRCSCPSIHISIYELMESLSSSGSKLQHYFKKKTLFWSFSGSFRPKAVLSYNFLRSSSHIGGLCSTFASPCRFRSRHLHQTLCLHR